MGKAIGKVLELTLVMVIAGIYLAVPLVMVWGWIRWARRSNARSMPSILSLVGFTFSNASGILAVFSVMYAHIIGGFPYYDPLLLRIYGVGSILSLTAVLFSLGGVWRSNPLRWHAPFCSVGMLLFWFVSAMGE
jgi:hypothetical protein